MKASCLGCGRSFSLRGGKFPYHNETRGGATCRGAFLSPGDVRADVLLERGEARLLTAERLAATVEQGLYSGDHDSEPDTPSILALAELERRATMQATA